MFFPPPSHGSLDRHYKHSRHVTSPASSHTLPNSRRHSGGGQSRSYSYVDPSSNRGVPQYYPSHRHVRQSSQPDPYENRGSGNSGFDSDSTLTPSSQTSYDGRRNPSFGTEHAHRRLSASELSGSQSDSNQGSQTSYHKTR